jgi:hypothetical protein
MGATGKKQEIKNIHHKLFMSINKSSPELIILITAYIDTFKEIPPVFSDDTPECILIEMLQNALSENKAIQDHYALWPVSFNKAVSTQFQQQLQINSYVPYRQQVDIIQAFALRGLQED